MERSRNLESEPPSHNWAEEENRLQYILFTYPNCPQCEALKTFLSVSDYKVQEYNLTQKESKMKIREFLDVLKRDDKGGIIIPTLIILTDGDVVAILNTREEFEDWSRSKD
jgi:glutaredoxin